MTQHTNLYAMKQALEALEANQYPVTGAPPDLDVIEAIAVLRLAIEQAEKQEPWEQFYPDIGKPQLSYPAPPQRQPLTDEQIALISAECALVTPSDIYFARAIERAHGIGGVK